MSEYTQIDLLELMNLRESHAQLQARVAELEKSFYAANRENAELTRRLKEAESIGQSANQALYDEEQENADLERRLQIAVEALGRVLPVLNWLEQFEEKSLGRSIAQQVKPIVERALHAIQSTGEKS